MTAKVRAAGLAAMLAACSASAVESYRMDASRNGGVFVLDAEVRIDAPIGAVHAVITDYENLERLSDRIKESRVLDAEPNSTLVFTRVEGCFAFFCRTIERVERVIEFAPNHIEATTLPEQSNVKYGKTMWVLHRDGDDATRVEYYLALQPDFWVPPFIGHLAIRRSLRADAAAMFERIEEIAAGAADDE
ncbi:MAG: SRPBCC family protein [Gammaproteobacteria bacterium]